MAHDREVLVAERLMSSGDYAGALGAFEALERAAPSPADRVELRLRRAEALRRADRADEAAEVVRGTRRVVDGDQLSPRLRAKVLMAEARLELDAGREPQGRALLREVVERFPGTEWAVRALQLLGLRARESDKDKLAFVVWCRRLAESAPDGPLADNLYYEVGRHHFERDTEADDTLAVAVYEVVIERFTIRSSGLWDDALWDLSLIHHRRRRFVDEIRLLERFIAERVEASAPGSYEHVNYKHAWLRVGHVLLEDLGQPAEAAPHFAEFPRVFQHALVRSEAKYFEAVAWERAGDPERAATARVELLRDYPESRWARRLRKERGVAP